LTLGALVVMASAPQPGRALDLIDRDRLGDVGDEAGRVRARRVGGRVVIQVDRWTDCE